MNDMGSCSFAGLREPGSFLQLLSVESGFCSGPGTMALGAAGWHMRRSAGHCSPRTATAPAVTRTLRPSVTLWLAACSHIAYRCTREEKQSLSVTFLPLGLFLKRKMCLLEEIPWNQSLSPQVPNTGLPESYLDSHTTALLFIHQIFYIFTFIIKRQNFSLTLFLRCPVLPHMYLRCDFLHNFRLKSGSSWCSAWFTQTVLKTFKNALNLDLVLTLVPVILKALWNYCLTSKKKPAEYLCSDPILNGKQHRNSL